MSFDIAPGTLMAIVGRNGASKTTLVNSLVRLFELSCGPMLIIYLWPDSNRWHRHIKSTARAPPQLHHNDQPRARVFVGTLRQNLDPYQEYQDTELEQAVRKSCLPELLTKGMDI